MSRRIGLFVNGFDNNEDIDKKLKAGVNDVSRIYGVLTSEQFGKCDRTESKMYTNVKTRKEFGNILYDTLKILNPTDQFIFYFSGHGEHNNSVYHLKFGSDLFSFKTFLSELESRGISKAIIILDACFSGSAVVPKNSINNINIPPLPQGVAILTSSTENQFSYEKKNKSFSVFTDLLCECIETGNGKESTSNDFITIEDIVTYVEKNNVHKDKQEPKYKIENAKNSIWVAKNITQKEVETKSIETETYGIMSDIEKINYDNSCFIDKVNTKITVDELNWTLIQEYIVNKKLDINLLLEKKNILEELNFTIQEKIINGVILNFANRPDKFIPQAHVVIILDTYTNNKRFYGSNIQLLKQVLKFLDDKLEKFSYRNEEGIRVDGSVIPKDILREALSNALVHRCYENCNKPIRVILLEKEEQIIIESPGDFLGDYKKILLEEDNCFSDSRDAKMSDYLIHLGGAEGVGTGFKFFKEYRKKEGEEAVSFITDNKFTKIILKFQKRESISSKINQQNIVTTGDNNIVHFAFPPHVTPKALTTQTGLANDIDFLGRKEELDKIDKLLNQNSMLLMLNGIGGVGKSSLASYYLNQKKDNFDYYGFVKVNEDIKLSFISAFSISLDLKSEKIDDLFAEIMNKLHNLEGKKLLIIDDVKEVDNQLEEMEMLITLKNSGFQILFTSRETKDSIPQYFLNVMSLEDARELFLVHYPTDEMDKVDKILEYLDYHTLFIEITARILKKRKRTLPLDKIIEKFANGEFSSIRKNESQSFNLFLNNLVGNDKVLQDEENILFLKRLSVLPSIEISFDKLFKLLDIENEEKLEDSLIKLVTNGWIIESINGYKLHKILKNYILENYEITYQDIEYIIQNILVEVKNSLDIEVSILNKDNILYFESLERIIRVLDITNEVIIKLFISFGNIYSNLSMYMKAENVYKYALIMSEKFINIDTSIINNCLGIIYEAKGNYKEAEDFYLKALVEREKISNKSPETATSYNNLAELYTSIGEYGKAESLYFKALEIYIKILGEEHIDTSTTYNNIANLYLNMGDYIKSEQFYLKALRIREKILGQEHPELAVSYNNLGELYKSLGNYEKSLLFNQQALKIREMFLGEEHIDTASSYINIAGVYKELLKLDNALALYKKSLNIYTNIFNNIHPDIALIYGNMAGVYETKNDFLQARILYEKSLKINIDSFGKQHPSTATSYNNLAVLLYHQEEYDGAYDYLNKAIEIRKVFLPSEHPYLTEAEEGLRRIEKKLRKE